MPRVQAACFGRPSSIVHARLARLAHHDSTTLDQKHQNLTAAWRAWTSGRLLPRSPFHPGRNPIHLEGTAAMLPSCSFRVRTDQAGQVARTRRNGASVAGKGRLTGKPAGAIIRSRGTPGLAFLPFIASQHKGEHIKENSRPEQRNDPASAGRLCFGQRPVTEACLDTDGKKPGSHFAGPKQKGRRGTCVYCCASCWSHW